MYILPCNCPEELWFESCKKMIDEAISKKQWLKAQNIAIAWAHQICRKWNLEETEVWKFFKRSVAVRWFGEVECKRFQPGWSSGEVFEYARSFRGRSLRLSLFPKKIACHATSLRLPAGRMDQWERIIAQADNSIAIEVFLESSTSNSICFRRRSTQFGEEIVYEAGKGQAVYVFEQEQGQHPIVVARKSGTEFEFLRKSFESKEDIEIEKKLKRLIKIHEDDLAIKSFCICSALGINYLSIEGYFDSTERDSIRIVDLDMPFDFVFMKVHDSQRTSFGR